MHQSLQLTHEGGRPDRLPQYFAALSASLGGLVVGTIIGYASPATYQLREDSNATDASNPTQQSRCYEDNMNSLYDHANCLYDSIASYVSQSITETKMAPAESVSLNSSELSWFSSSFSIGALIGGLLAGVLIHHAGRRGGMMVSVIPSLAGWLCIGFGRSFWPLVVGRTLTGVYTGLACVAVNTYISEISYNDIRGMLGTSFQFMFGAGILYAYSFGAFMNWDALAFVCCVPPVVFCVLVFFNPESPAFLVANGKRDKGRKALQKLRGPSWDVSEELQTIETSAEEESNNRTTLKDLFSPALLRPLIIVLGVMIFQQLCGINALVFNLNTIFKSAGSSMDASLSSVLVSLVQMLATLLAYFFIETGGRKLLLVISAVFMAVGHALVGLFFYLLETEEAWTQQHLGWLPLFAVVVFQLAFSIGYGPVPWIIMGEMFPSNMREKTSSLAIVTNWTASFFVIFSFEPLQVGTVAVTV